MIEAATIGPGSGGADLMQCTAGYVMHHVMHHVMHYVMHYGGPRLLGFGEYVGLEGLAELHREPLDAIRRPAAACSK